MSRRSSGKRHAGSRRSVGFYKDSRGRIRPITPRVTTISGHNAVRNEKEWNESGFWMDTANGERVWVPESEIPEENRLDVSLGFWGGSDPERYRKDSINYLEQRINGLKDSLWDVRSSEERNQIAKLMTYYQHKIEEFKKFRPSVSDSRKSHLYRNGTKYREKKKFEERYGKRKGDYVYGAVVGKVRRERLAKGRQ